MFNPLPEDLDEVAPSQLLEQLPPEPEPVPTLDAPYDPTYPVDLARVTIPLRKDKYANRQIAEVRARQLASIRGLRFLRMFETAAYYVAKYAPRMLKVVP